MNFDIWHALIVGFYLGVGAGWWFNRKPPVIKDIKVEAKLVVDKNFLDKIEQERVLDWLDRRGLTWQPKGAVFEPGKDIKK